MTCETAARVCPTASQPCGLIALDSMDALGELGELDELDSMDALDELGELDELDELDELTTGIVPPMPSFSNQAHTIGYAFAFGYGTALSTSNRRTS
jgi:hypothetical protein